MRTLASLPKDHKQVRWGLHLGEKVGQVKQKRETGWARAQNRVGLRGNQRVGLWWARSVEAPHMLFSR